MTDHSARSVIEKRALAAVCVCVLCGILIAGLWPFFPPKNEVSWLDHENGLRFGEHGVIFSSGPLNMPDLSGENACGIELWLQPGLSFDTNTILDVYTPQNPFQFRMGQSGDDLVIQRGFRDHQNHVRTFNFYVDHVFRQDRKVLITLAADAQGASIYLNGREAKSSSQFRLMHEALRGQLIVGAAPVQDERWSGKLLGLAIYNQRLNPDRVLQDYREWTENGRPIATPEKSVGALYMFSERAGGIVHDQVTSAPDLYIPKRFRVVGQVFLEPPWKEFYSDWSYCKDVLINIVGFVPLGFCFCAYLSRIRLRNRAAFETILIGGAISVAIEVLQAYIPTRQSGMTDIITNTLGTSCGTLLFQCKPVQSFIGELHLAPSHHTQGEERRLGGGTVFPEPTASIGQSVGSIK